ncbi:drongo [Trypoxylus dichotomus]
MASARKKQDEKHLKTLRELVSLPYNKYCFDCNQRGPTYVNVTIGSFVCTKCSGMLRGLTPPHRVKSISMATFTSEEVELVQNRGNDYCRRTWLGLYEGAPLTEGRDEQQIHDLMVDKYERRRYYIDQPVSSSSNSSNSNSSTTASSSVSNNNNNSSHNVRANGGLTTSSFALPNNTAKLSSFNSSTTTAVPQQQHNDINSSTTRQSPLRLANGSVDRMKTNGITISRPVVPSSMAHPNVIKSSDFANFDSADIFNAANNNSILNGGSNDIITNGVHTTQQQPFFANFDNNPVFTNTSVQNTNNVNQQKIITNVPPAPPEDRYAALKDLDNALKNQSTLDWSSSNSSLYSSPTPASSMYNSSSPQSLYGSPSQGQFISIFSQQETGSNNASNPFNSSGQLWGNSSTLGATTTTTPLVNGLTNGSSNPNPFRVTAHPASDPFKMNGFTQTSFQPTTFTSINGAAWTANPFKVTSNGHSNNPFL